MNNNNETKDPVITEFVSSLLAMSHNSAASSVERHGQSSRNLQIALDKLNAKLDLLAAKLDTIEREVKC